jgi:hypothetical protein
LTLGSLIVYICNHAAELDLKMSVALLSDFIVRKYLQIGTDKPLHEVIDAVIADAMACLAAALRAGELGDLAQATFRSPMTARYRPGDQELAQVMLASRKPAPHLLTPPLAEAVVRTLGDFLGPVARSGIGSRPRDIWKLLWLPAIGLKMPVVAELLREQVGRNPKRRKAAKDEKYLWRLRTKALKAIAETVAPLLPLPLAA